MELISWDDFEKIEMRVGTIIEVSDFSRSKKTSLSITN